MRGGNNQWMTLMWKKQCHLSVSFLLTCFEYKKKLKSIKLPQEHKNQSLHSPKITALTWNIIEKGKSKETYWEIGLCNCPTNAESVLDEPWRKKFSQGLECWVIE